jgi:hypothetical protein
VEGEPMVNVPAGMRTNFIPIELINSFSAAMSIVGTAIISTVIDNMAIYLMPHPFSDSDVTSLKGFVPGIYSPRISQAE